MKKSTLSLFWLVAALVISVLGACGSTRTVNNNNRRVPDTHTSRFSLSWPDSYIGTIFSPGGRMIDALLYLSVDDTFELSYSYRDKPDKINFNRGKFKWDETERIITLELKDFPLYYFVAENGLIQLDGKGKVITGKQAENYVLEKMPQDPGICD